MTDLFQIPLAATPAGDENPFDRFGLAGNPFPAAGLDSGVLFSEHMIAELQRVNRWITQVGQVAPASAAPAEAVPPLAIFGSLGVGKTHLLATLERGISRDASFPVLRKSLADEGAGRLVLANLFLRYLPMCEQDDEPGSRLLRLIVRRAREGAPVLQALREGSPLRAPLGALMRADADADAVVWLSRWLRREYTTPIQRAKLSLAGVLENEGQAIRAVADLIRLARAAGLLRAWFVMIDQLEELWREGVVTPPRRARFLTDLRMLIDQSLEGAPIAVLLAWNTTPSDKALPSNVGEQIQRDYLALWQRLGTPIDLRPLGADHIWRFAEAYLRAKGVSPDAGGQRSLLFTLLEREVPRVTSALRQKVPAQALFPPRLVLSTWRDVADEVARRVA